MTFTALTLLGERFFMCVQGDSMVVVLNGKETEAAQDMTVADLLAAKDITPETVVVERNGEIVPGENFASTALEDGDHLEVLRFVGGG